MKVVQPFQLKPFGELVPGELFRLYFRGQSALCLKLLGAQSPNLQRTGILDIPGAELERPVWIDLDLNSFSRYHVLSYGVDRALEFSEVGHPGYTGHEGTPGLIELHPDGFDPLLTLAALPNTFHDSIEFDLSTWSASTLPHSKGTAAVTNWRIWAREDQVNKPGSKPIFDFKGLQAS